MAPPNDNLVNAEVIVPSHISTLSGTTVDATFETDEFNQGYDQPSVWYKIAALSYPTQGNPDFAPGKLRLTFTAADYLVYGDFLSGPSGATSYNDLTLLDNLSPVGGYFEWDLEEGITYYIYVGNSDFDGSTGTFSLESRFTYSVVPAVDEPTSATTTVISDGVRDTQLIGGTYAASVSLLPSAVLSASDEIPSMAGRWQIRIWLRANDPTPTSFPTPRIRYNMQVNGIITWMDLAEGVETPPFGSVDPFKAELHTGEDFVIDGGGYGFGGFVPWVGITPGDTIKFAIGHDPTGDETSADLTLVEYFLDSENNVGLRTAGWHVTGRNRHNAIGEANIVTGDTHRLARAANGDIYLIALVERLVWEAPNNEWQRGVWKLTRMGADWYDPDDNPLGFDNNDLGLWLGDTSDVDGTGLAICILDNGNIVASWIERRNAGSGTHSVYRFHGPVVWEWNGSSWTSLTSCLSQWGNNTDYVRGGLDMATDGTNIFVVYYEWNDVFGPQTTGYFSDNFRWHCHKWNGSTWTELGSGQQNDTTRTVTPNIFASGKAIAVDVDPDGNPWVTWFEEDDTVNAYHKAFCWRWNGSSWVDTNLPQPTFLSGVYYANIVSEERGIDLIFADENGFADYPMVVYGMQSATGQTHWKLNMTKYNGTSWSSLISVPYATWFTPSNNDFPNGSLGTVMLETSPSGRPYLMVTKFSDGSHDVATLDADGLGFTTLSRPPFFNAVMAGLFELYPLAGFTVTQDGRAILVSCSFDFVDSIMPVINEVEAAGAIDLTRVKFRSFAIGDI